MITRDPATTPATDLRRRLIAVGVGNFIEWYDFAIYGFFAVAIGANFFPSGDPTASLLSTLAVYGVAFLMRPLGGFVIGAIGDRRGRRFALVFSVTMMGLATALIAFLPNFATIGIAAPIILVLLRGLQGFSAGGEYTGSTAFLVENSSPQRRGLTASIIPFTGAIAVAAGAGTALLIANLPADAVLSWGWRLPFLTALPLTLLGLYLRLKLEDTEVFRELKAEGAVVTAPIRTVMTSNAKALAVAFGLSAITVLGFYYLAAYAVNYLLVTVAMAPPTALTVVGIGALVYACFCPLMGSLSDRIGRRPVSLIGGIGLALFSVPAFLLMLTGNPFLAVLGMLLFGVFQAMHISTTTVMFIELFPAETRLTGSSIGYNLAAAIVAGPGPLIAAALAAVSAGLPALYMAVVAAVCTGLLFRSLPETRWNDISANSGATSEPTDAARTAPTSREVGRGW
ncbi:MFS transporter [Microbacterium sp. RD1]|uniref:MFS transporter n=1 Tax=Microbacterium sp. RD1 TaxID=3457313 RepID=UPI003FA5CFDB